MLKLVNWEARQLVFLDESAANERSAHRKYGWAPIGITPHVIVSAKRSERWSILPAYTMDGFLVWNIVQDSYNTGSFNEFVEHQLLLLYELYPGNRSIIIMDNAPIHRSQVSMNP
jgi:hypothetical protein